MEMFSKILHESYFRSQILVFKLKLESDRKLKAMLNRDIHERVEAA